MVVHENPYVGPKAFERKDASFFFGRDEEAEELLALVVSERVVLFYAQSGAGKTSLINARLVPDLEKEDFEVLPVARVGGENLENNDVENVYVFNVLSYLTGHGEEEAPRLMTSLSEFLNHCPAEADAVTPRVLILDQFEEILTAHPERRQDRDGFFRQLRQALDADRRLSVLFAMREDRIAGLDRYAHLLPGRLRTRFRMERLRSEDAGTAIRRPAEEAGRSFAEGIAEELVDNLRQERTADREKTTPGEFVEPVQLQVVCFQLWESLRDSPGEEITGLHLKAFGNVDQALESFCEDAIARVAHKTRVAEMKIVRWFSKTLITSTGLRASVHREEESTGGLPNTAVERLEKEHLIRAEHVRGGIWYELVHDRFIEPIMMTHRHRVQARKKTLSRLLTAAMIAALFVAAVSFQNSLRQQREAANRADVLEMAVELTAEARRWLAVDPPTAFDFASLAVLLTYREDGTALPEAEGVLRQVLHSRPARRLWKRSAERVSELGLSSDGRFLATGHDGGEVLVMDSRSGALIREFSAHADLISELAFGRDGTLLATLTCEKECEKTSFKVWDTSSFEESLTVFGDPFSFETLAFSPDGTRLATAAANGIIWIWDSISGDRAFDLTSSSNPAASMTFSPEGDRLAITSTGKDATVRIRAVDSGEEKGVVGGYVAAFSADGKKLAVASHDLQLKVWDGDGDEEVWPVPEGDGEIEDLAFGPRGEHLVTVTRHGAARIWDLASERNSVILGPRGAHALASLRRDGRQLAVSEGDEVSVWEIFFEDVPTLFSHDGGVEAVAFSPDGKRLATAGSDSVTKIWDVLSLTLLQTLEGHEKPIKALAFSPDGNLLATASEDRTARLWNPEDGSSRHPPMEHHASVEAVAFSPDGRRLVTGSQAGRVRSWESRSGTELPASGRHESAVTAAAFSSDGRRVATASADGFINVWDAETLRPENSWKGHADPIGALAFSTDGTLLATCSLDETAKIWNVKTRELAQELADHKDTVTTVAFSPDGERLATGSGDGAVIFWKIGFDERLFALPESGAQVLGVAFSPQGEYLAVAREDGKVRLEPGSLEALILQAEERSRP